MEGEVDPGLCACLSRLGLAPLSRTRRAVEESGGGRIQNIDQHCISCKKMGVTAKRSLDVSMADLVDQELWPDSTHYSVMRDDAGV
jgi:hypothetical protein